jgi:hypothetical protein
MSESDFSTAWLVLAEMLGVVMSRKAAEIYRRLDPAQLPPGPPDETESNSSQLSLRDRVVLGVILELASEAFRRPGISAPDERDAEALVGLVCLADCAEGVCLQDLLNMRIQAPADGPKQDRPLPLQTRVEARPPKKASRAPGGVRQPHRRHPSRAARRGGPRRKR